MESIEVGMGAIMGLGGWKRKGRQFSGLKDYGIMLLWKSHLGLYKFFTNTWIQILKRALEVKSR